MKYLLLSSIMRDVGNRRQVIVLKKFTIWQMEKKQLSQ